MKTKPQDSLKWRCQAQDEESADETEQKWPIRYKNIEVMVITGARSRCFEKEVINCAVQ